MFDRLIGVTFRGFFARNTRINAVYKEAESLVNPDWRFRDADNRDKYRQKIMSVTGFPHGQWDRDEMKDFWDRQENGEKVRSMARSWIHKRRAAAAQDFRGLKLDEVESAKRKLTDRALSDFDDCIIAMMAGGVPESRIRTKRPSLRLDRDGSLVISFSVRSLGL